MAAGGFTMSRILAFGLAPVLCSVAFTAPAPPAPPAPPDVARVFAFAPGSGSYLGVNVQEIDSARARELKLKEERGVEITMVADESPAAAAGFRKGDVVLEYNGQRVEGTEQFVRLVRETPSGRPARVAVWRDGKEQTLSAKIGNRASGRPFPAGELVVPEIRIPDFPRPHMSWRSQTLGIEAETVDGQLASFFGVERGVLVRNVHTGSAAEKAGIKAGDVVTKAGGESVETPSELSSRLRSRNSDAAAEASAVTLTVVRDRKEITIPVTPDQSPSRTQRRGPARRVVIGEERF
ncbi:MAG: PDZ domain-containing protein [Bryobacteraceae bacterium]